MDDLETVRQEYLAFREQGYGAFLATLDERQAPAASYAPLAWLDGQPYLLLSDLASHAGNLRRCPSLGLVLIEGEGSGANAFARRRITLQGEARPVPGGDSRCTAVLAEFRRRYGEVVSLLESLPDFHLFRLQLQAGRYIRGFGQAYELTGDGLDRLQHINPAK